MGSTVTGICADILEQPTYVWGKEPSSNRVVELARHRLHRLAESIPGLLKSIKIPSLDNRRGTPIKETPRRIITVTRSFLKYQKYQLRNTVGW
jgi:hypothetical protein